MSHVLIADRDWSEKEGLSVAETNSPIKGSTQTEKKSNQSQTDDRQLLPKTEKQVTIAPKSDQCSCQSIVTADSDIIMDLFERQSVYLIWFKTYI